MESRYIVNISRGGLFWGRLEYTGVQESRAIARAEEVRQRFPEGEGFKVDLTYWGCSGRPVSF